MIICCNLRLYKWYLYHHHHQLYSNRLIVIHVYNKHMASRRTRSSPMWVVFIHVEQILINKDNTKSYQRLLMLDLIKDIYVWDLVKDTHSTFIYMYTLSIFHLHALIMLTRDITWRPVWLLHIYPEPSCTITHIPGYVVPRLGSVTKNKQTIF